MSARGTRYFGKYRGLVSDVEDPQKIGRLRAHVPEILGDVESGWALPCAPYAGEKSGSFTVPPVGAGVWIEFEAGEVSRPIWAGCYWNPDKIPTDEQGTPATPKVRILRSEAGLLLSLDDDAKTIALSDEDAKNIVQIDVQKGTVFVTGGTKVVVDAKQIELVADAQHAFVFGDSLMTYLNNLVTSLNTHMHPGEMAGPYPVVPMMPAPPLQPPTPDLLSTKVKGG